MSDTTSSPSLLAKIDWDRVSFDTYQKSASQTSGRTFYISSPPTAYLCLHPRHLRLEPSTGAFVCYGGVICALLFGAMSPTITIFMVTPVATALVLAGVFLHCRTRRHNQPKIDCMENIARRIKRGEDVFHLLSYREMKHALRDLGMHTRCKLYEFALGHQNVVTLHDLGLNVQNDPRLPGVLTWQMCWITNKDAILHALRTAYTVGDKLDVPAETLHEAYLRLAKVYRLLLEHEIPTPSIDS